MTSKLPPRPNLDHLRRQAKSLLAALEAGDAKAASTFMEHLPAAAGMKPGQVRAARFRLADAQAAVARQTGFASWPRLARHVEQLRALEGIWEFQSLEVEGQPMPAAAMASSRLLIDGDRFRNESPGAAYEGVFNIDVEAEPHGIDLEFIAGPEAGNTNRGIFRFDGDRLEICLDMTGKGRPAAFKSSPGTGHAFEVLRRSSRARPEAVTGGTPPATNAAPPAIDEAAARREFRLVASPTLSRLQGEWTAESLVKDGQEFPAMMLKTARRSAKDNEIRITFGGQTVIHALVRIDESASPMHVDYYNIGGQAKGTLQQGIMEWRGGSVCLCMANPGQPRPTEFTSLVGSGRTLSRWRPEK